MYSISILLFITSLVGIVTIFVFLFWLLSADNQELQPHDADPAQNEIIEPELQIGNEDLTRKRLSKLEKKRIKAEQRANAAAAIAERNNKAKASLEKWRERYGHDESNSDSDCSDSHSKHRTELLPDVDPHSLETVSSTDVDNVLSLILRDKV